MKIGFTDGEPEARLRALQTGSASLLELAAVIPDAPAWVERDLHRQFADLRLRANGEWFVDHPRIHEAFDKHAAKNHRRHLLERIDKACKGLDLLDTHADEATTGDLERGMRLMRKLLDESSCSCSMQSTPSAVDDPVRAFWEEFRERLAWDLVPFTFAYALCKAWFADVSPSGSVVSYKPFVNDLVAIVRDDPMWHCPDKNKAVRPGQMMDAPEPLIAEYDLKKWMNPHYSGSDPLKKSQPVKQANYRGLLRTVGTVAHDADDEGDE